MVSSPPSDSRVDVAVVGGGFAGLSAATALMRAGIHTMVLEAQDRIGGRVHSERAADGHVYERGGQFFNRGMPRLMGLVEEHGLTIRSIRQDPGTLLLSEGRLKHGGPDGCLTESFWKEFATTAPDAFSSIEDWLVSRAEDPATTALCRSGIEELWGRDPAQVSFTSARLELGEDKEPMDHSLAFACVEGLGELANRMAAGLGPNLRIRAPVLQIDRQDGCFLLTSAQGRVTARHLVMACSPAMLSRPAWTAPQDRWLNSFSSAFAPGQMRKIVLRYPSPFWQGGGFGWMAQSDVPTGFSVVDSSDQRGGFETLSVFAGGRTAAAWSELPDDQVLSTVLDILDPILGAAVRSPLTVVQTDWTNHPWVGGGYNSWPRPWRTKDPIEALRTPRSAIHFACAEIAPAYRGFIEGAIRAGLSVAERILATEAKQYAGLDA